MVAGKNSQGLKFDIQETHFTGLKAGVDTSHLAFDLTWVRPPGQRRKARRGTWGTREKVSSSLDDAA